MRKKQEKLEDDKDTELTESDEEGVNFDSDDNWGKEDTEESLWEE